MEGANREGGGDGSGAHLDVHGLLVGLKLAPLGALVLLHVPLPRHLRLLPIAAAHLVDLDLPLPLRRNKRREEKKRKRVFLP